MFNFHRKLTLEQRIYNDILHILCLYENEDIFYSCDCCSNYLQKYQKLY